ncbi:MAG: type III-B CRISPR module RAMP protein Cmr4 [Armatimonadota bacterium]|nr:type III-B CRISPR module RAMP protein Cmr4 [Armatimonadota bacterium]
MFEAASLLFIYVETPLHAGSGRSLGAVDLPIQRERTTDYPIIQASSIKGRLRDECKNKSGLSNEEHLAIFGPETGNASDHAGALSVGDARILLFPVRSLAGVFAWTTSINALARFLRDASAVGVKLNLELPEEPNPDSALVAGDELKAGDRIVLEEFSFEPVNNGTVNEIGKWLESNALPEGNEYKYWRESLPKKLCILPEDAFRDFVKYATEVQTHIKLDDNTKTVAKNALWTSESLPTDSLLYAPLMATKSRRESIGLSGKDVLQKLAELKITRTRLGGDETTGQGVVALRFYQPSGGDQK